MQTFLVLLILFISLGILFKHFFPKIYRTLLKKESSSCGENCHCSQGSYEQACHCQSSCSSCESSIKTEYLVKANAVKPKTHNLS